MHWELLEDYCIFTTDVRGESFTEILRLQIYFLHKNLTLRLQNTHIFLQKNFDKDQNFLNLFYGLQICDFGLAKWLPGQWTHLTVSKFEGTFGFVFVTLFCICYVMCDSLSVFVFLNLYYFRYLAPEFLMHGIVDEKTDVFAFGVLLLELITGRRALDYSQQSLVMWVCLLLPSLYIP